MYNRRPYLWPGVSGHIIRATVTFTGDTVARQFFTAIVSLSTLCLDMAILLCVCVCIEFVGVSSKQACE